MEETGFQYFCFGVFALYSNCRTTLKWFQFWRRVGERASRRQDFFLRLISLHLVISLLCLITFGTQKRRLHLSDNNTSSSSSRLSRAVWLTVFVNCLHSLVISSMLISVPTGGQARSSIFFWPTFRSRKFFCSVGLSGWAPNLSFIVFVARFNDSRHKNDAFSW